jgi:Family of unknown function (DUF6152)
MRKIIDLVFLATVTLASSTYALADPASTDPKLSAECRAAMDLVARSESLYKSLIENGAAIEASEKKYFDRFNADKTITLTGTVNEFQWRNPHARIMLTVRNEQGQADQQWVIEMNTAAALARLGWRPKTLTPGMPITVTIHPLRDGSNAGHLLTAGLPDGTQMNGGRDRPDLLQQIRQQAAAAESAVAELEKKQRLLGCDH